MNDEERYPRVDTTHKWFCVRCGIAHLAVFNPVNTEQKCPNCHHFNYVVKIR